MKLKTAQSMTYMRIQPMGLDMNKEEELPAETKHDTINNEDICSLHMEVCCFDTCLSLKTSVYLINAIVIKSSNIRTVINNYVTKQIRIKIM